MARFDRALLPTRNNNSYFSNNVNQIFKPLVGGGEDPRISLIVLNYQRYFAVYSRGGQHSDNGSLKGSRLTLKKKKKLEKHFFFLNSWYIQYI